MPSGCRAVEFIHEPCCFQGAEEEMIPNIFKSHLHAQFFSQRHCFAQLIVRAAVGIRVGNPLGHAARDYEDRGSPIAFGVAQGLFHTFHRGLALRSLNMREVAGMLAASDAGNLQAGFVAGTQHLLLIQMAGRFDPVKPGVFEHLKFFQEWKILPRERIEHVAFFHRGDLRKCWKGAGTACPHRELFKCATTGDKLSPPLS